MCKEVKCIFIYQYRRQNSILQVDTKSLNFEINNNLTSKDF